MTYHDCGAFYKVTCTHQDVSAFASRWPCFGTHRQLIFEFDKRNNDLVDIIGRHDDIDPTGLSALICDAQTFANRNPQ